MSPMLRFKVQRWLREYLQEAKEDNLTDLINMYGIGEVNTTLLADAVVYESPFFKGQNHDAILEDETHWVWDEIINATDWWEQTKVGEE